MSTAIYNVIRRVSSGRVISHMMNKYHDLVFPLIRYIPLSVLALIVIALVLNANPAVAQTNTVATGKPTIAGILQVGEELTASTSEISDADGLANVACSYQLSMGAGR